MNSKPKLFNLINPLLEKSIPDQYLIILVDHKSRIDYNFLSMLCVVKKLKRSILVQSVFVMLVMTVGCGKESDLQTFSAEDRLEEAQQNSFSCARAETSKLQFNASFIHAGFKSGVLSYIPESYCQASAQNEFGVMVYIHGDSREIKWYIKSQELKDFADKNKMILLTLEAPGYSNVWWTPRKHERANYFLSAMNFLFFKSQPRFPHVDKNRLYLVSSSGGATWANGFEFYTQFKMPFKHILMAGGDVPRENSDFNFSENDNHPDGLKDDPKMTIKKEEIPASAFNAVKYYYLIGTADELLPTVNEAMKLYQELGFKTDIELLNGVRHADFTYPDKIISMYNKIQRMENLPPPSF